jgi:hypothetical protein
MWLNVDIAITDRLLHAIPEEIARNRPAHAMVRSHKRHGHHERVIARVGHCGPHRQGWLVIDHEEHVQIPR